MVPSPRGNASLFLLFLILALAVIPLFISRWEHPFISLAVKLTLIVAAIVAYFFMLASRK